MNKIKAIKKTQANSLAQLDNEVKVELSRIFDNASNIVDEYQDKPVSGVQVKQSAFGWLNKINYLLDELPDDHPVKKKGGAVQKLVNKLTELTATSNSEITYDMMVAGGKPPSLSKQRFLKPIENLIEQAKEDVIKPSVLTQTNLSVNVGNKPAGHLESREAAVIDKPKAKPQGIPKAESRQQVRRENLAGLSTNKKPILMEDIIHESGAQPGYLVNKVISLASAEQETYNQLAIDMNAIALELGYAQNMINKSKGNVRTAYNNSNKTYETFIANLKLDEGYSYSTGQRVQLSEISRDALSHMAGNYKVIMKLMDEILPQIKDASKIVERIELENQGLPSHSNWGRMLDETKEIIEKLIAKYHESNIENGDYRIFYSAVDNDFITLLDSAISTLLDDNTVNYALEMSSREAAGYSAITKVYGELASINKSKKVYNDFMEINDGNVPISKIASAVHKYLKSKVGNI